MDRSYFKPLARLLAFSAALTIAASAPAQTQAVSRQDNSRKFSDYEAAAIGYTNATTSYTVIPGSAIASTMVNDPGELTFQNATTYITDKLRVWWTADVSKATATTGSCEIFLNGTAIARSLRTQNYATGESTIGGFVELAYPTDPFNIGTPGQTQQADLRCVSGDTNTFAVNAVSIFVQEVY